MNDVTNAENKQKTVAIVGLGYVGSSLASLLADRGMRVRGIDIDAEIVESINNGCCPIEEETVSEKFRTYAGDDRISATTSFDAVEKSEVIIVTVGTPLAKSDPDVSAVKTASKQIGNHLHEGHLVIYRSTLPAKLTESELVPLLESTSNLTGGVDFDVAFCPERMAEGSAYEDMDSIPVVVGGLNKQSQATTEAFWEEAGLEVVSVSSPTAAEFTKLADNWWIDLNIALANEVALLSEKLGVNAMEVIAAANTLPKGQHSVNILYPGAGVGGSCLLKDPWFVANLGDEYDLALKTPRISREINQQMPDHMVTLAKQELSDLQEAEVAVLGYAFKSGTDDTRNTPAAEIIIQLRDAGANVRVADPYVPSDTVESEVDITPSRLPEAVSGVDAVLIVTGHDKYQSLDATRLEEYIGSTGAVVVDGRFVFDPDEMADTTLNYTGVGQGNVIYE